jgi:hypothetical protein
MVHGIDFTRVQAFRDDLDTEIANDCHKRRTLFAPKTPVIPARASLAGMTILFYETGWCEHFDVQTKLNWTPVHLYPNRGPTITN